MDKDADMAGGMLILVAGAKGAIGSTLAVSTAYVADHPERIHPYLTTLGRFGLWDEKQAVFMGGWDQTSLDMGQAIEMHGVLPKTLTESVAAKIGDRCRVVSAPDGSQMADQVARIKSDIKGFCAHFPGTQPVLVNLLPAAPQLDGLKLERLSDLEGVDPTLFPDLAYTLGAIEMGVPVVNFTPNLVVHDPVIQKARSNGVPMCGRDGKTGQTYLKMVLASALKARSLYVDGWYSTNILGNADGRNLMDPERAASKLSNKTKILDELLGYQVGERHDTPTHKVRIDYYPPRGDAKEAWDVIDILGLFDLPMSIRVNLQARDSILAAPMVLDLAQWMCSVQKLGRSGNVPELAFYFKKPEGSNAPALFEQQVLALDELARQCRHAG